LIIILFGASCMLDLLFGLWRNLHSAMWQRRWFCILVCTFIMDGD
jgi:hypothetical protein